MTFKCRLTWLFALAVAALPARAASVVANGDFSNGLTGWYDSAWRYNALTTVAAKVELDSTTTTYDSSKAPGLKIAVSTVNGTNWQLRYYLPTFTAVKGATYHLSFWAKSTVAGSLLLGIDSVSKYKVANGFSTAPTWKRFTFKYTAAADGPGAVNFSIYLGTATGTFYFDDFAIDEEAPVVLHDAMVQPTQGAWYTGKYRNLFVERGYNADTVKNRLTRAYNQLFLDPDTASKSIMRLVPTDSTMAFILAADPNTPSNSDIRSEGQSYGMILSVMLDRKDVFNKLWKFAKTYSQHQSDSNDLQGLFRWSLLPYAPFKFRGTYGYTPAPDGEEYYATALFLASKRWGDSTGWYAYGTQADSLLYYMRKKRKSNFSPIDSAAKQILFSATNGTKFTDASYHVPAFYRMWSAFTKNADSAFYRQMADTSLAFWKRHFNDSTGLCTEYADFNGAPHRNGSSGTTFGSTFFVYDTVYHSDSHRCSMNVGVDWAWFMPDTWEVQQSRKLLGFFYRKGGATAYRQTYKRTGDSLSSYSAAQSQMGSNGAAVLASDTARDWAFIDALYGIDVPSGNYRYYNGLIYLLGYTHASGDFKAYGSPGLSNVSSLKSAQRTPSLEASLRGQILTLTGATGSVARLLDANGREFARTRVQDGQAELALPGRGLWIVESGSAHRTVLIP